LELKSKLHQQASNAFNQLRLIFPIADWQNVNLLRIHSTPVQVDSKKVFSLALKKAMATHDLTVSVGLSEYGLASTQAMQTHNWIA